MIKEKFDKLNFIKMTNFSENSKWVENVLNVEVCHWLRQNTDNPSDNGFASRMCTGLLQINFLKQKLLHNNGQKLSIGISQKEINKW